MSALLDAGPVLDEDTDGGFHHTVYLLGNGTLLGLHQHRSPAPDGAFSEPAVGRDPDGIALALFAPPAA
jgi:hypothetical protein